jgi:hypothetical protein
MLLSYYYCSNYQASQSTVELEIFCVMKVSYVENVGTTLLLLIVLGAFIRSSPAIDYTYNKLLDL